VDRSVSLMGEGEVGIMKSCSGNTIIRESCRDPGRGRTTSTELSVHVSLEDLKKEDGMFCMAKTGCGDEQQHTKLNQSLSW
jgi:hypothetical protein